jgi:hypothetical protein
MSNNVVCRIAFGVLVGSMIEGTAHAQVAPRWEVAAASSGAHYEFRTFEVCPGCLTGTGGINDRGFIGAALIAADGSALQGYVYDSNAGIAIAIPGSLAATVPSTNGRTPGWGFGPGGLVPVIGERDGSATVLAGFPGAAITAILQFSRDGASVGWSSQDFVVVYSFFRSADGVYRKLEYPGPVGHLTFGTVLLGWNQAGTMIGYLSDPTLTEFAGLIRHPDGTWEVWNVPGSTSTIVFAITESGTLAGTYKDASGWHGFVWTRGVLQTVDAPGATHTAISGINNQGDLAGNTFTGESPVLSLPTTAFVATRQGGR